MFDLNDLVSAEIAASERPRTFGQFTLSLLGRIRTQLVLGLLAALAVPGVLFWYVTGLSLSQSEQLQHTLIGACFAFGMGYVTFRKVTAFPGIRASTNVLPAFATSYSLVALFFFALRIDYNRLVILSSFLATVVVLYGVFVLARRASAPQLTLATVGSFAPLARLGSIRWRLLDTPDLAKVSGALVVDLGAVLTPAWEKFIADCALAGRPVFNAREVMESVTGRVTVQHLSENSFRTLTPNTIYGAAKRHLDVLTALLLLVVLAPLMITLAFWIRFDSRGPALFRQPRRGFRGRIFVCYKFRTMRVDAGAAASGSGEARDQAVTKDNDPRVTRAGRFLRKTRLDELPQLINIILGHMSWIGPRPEAKVLSDWYEEEILFYRYRHVVRPGITGWAQVRQGHVASIEDVRTKLEYDFYYAKHFSFWLDVLVALQTIGIMISGRGAK